MKRLQKNISLFILGLLLIFSSCIKEEFDISKVAPPEEIEPGFAVPIAYADFKINELIEQRPDTLAFVPDGDNHLITLYHARDTLVSWEITDFYELPNVEAIDEEYNLDTFDIEERTITGSMSLDQLIDQMENASSKTAVQTAKDNSPSIFPPVSLTNCGDFTFTDIDNIDWATFHSGTLEVTLTNNFLVEIDTLYLGMKNKDSNEHIDTLKYYNLAPGTSQTQTTTLDGETIRSEVVGEIIGLSTPGSTSAIQINDNYRIDIEATLTNLVIEAGKALIPVQEAMEQEYHVDMLNSTTERVYEIAMNSGAINIQIQSEFDANADLILNLPATFRNGTPLSFIIPIDSTSPGSPILAKVDLSNTIMNLSTIDSMPYNLIPMSFQLDVKEPNQKVYFNKDKKISIKVDVETDSDAFEYAIGFFGSQSEKLEEEIQDFGTEIFKNIEGGLTLNDPQFDFLVKNDMGVPIDLNIDFMGINKNGNEVDLNEGKNNNGYISIQPAVSLTEGTNDTIKLRNNNSGVVDFISNSPCQIKYSGEEAFNINYNMTVDSYNASENPGISKDKHPYANFIRADGGFTIGLGVELPLIMQTASLSYNDTIDVDVKDMLGEGITDKVKKAILTIYTVNSLPFTIEFNTILYDSVENVNRDTLDVTFIKAATVDEVYGNVTAPTEHVENIVLTNEQVEALRNSNKLILKGTFKTSQDGAIPVKVHSENSLFIKFGLKADLQLKTDELDEIQDQ